MKKKLMILTLLIVLGEMIFATVLNPYTEDNSTNMRFEVIVGLDYVTKVGFIANSDDVGFLMDDNNKVDIVYLKMRDRVLYQYITPNQDVPTPSEKVYFYWVRYDDSGCTINLSPDVLSREGAEPITYSITMSEVNSNEKIGTSTLASDRVVKSGESESIIYQGGEPEIHIYELKFNIDPQTDVPAGSVPDVDYTGTINISVIVN